MFLLKTLLMLLPVLISVAFLTLFERKFLGVTGIRLGPYKVSILGFLQPIGDAVKLGNKQVNLLSNSFILFYYISSLLLFFGGLFLWSCSFLEPSCVSFGFSVFIFLILLSFNSLISIFSGWSLFSKYPLLGSLRTVSQLVSYEAALYFCLFFLFLSFSSYSFNSFNYHFTFSCFLLLPPLFYIWLPCILAELNRTPYDFSESESELVSGFNTDFGSFSFTLVFLYEYTSIVFICLLSSFLFFLSQVFFFFFLGFLVWIRAVLPRFRFDKLMSLSWKFFIPFLTCYFLYFGSIFY